MTSTLAAATAFVLFLAHGALAQKTILNVDVYYESLCGDSVRFISEQLAPNYENLKDHLHINFIPYGKASHTLSAGRWHFTCQHGPTECKGNSDQACALQAIEKSEAPENQQYLSVKLVSCVMSRHRPKSVSSCAQSVGLSEESRRMIADCQGTSTADELLAAHGDRTDNLNPVLTFVPTVIINGENHGAVLGEFRRVVCSLIPQNEKPAACTHP